MVVNHHLLCADLAVKDGSYGAGDPGLRHADPRRGAPDRGRGDAVLRRAGLLAPGRGAGARRRARAQGREPRRARAARRGRGPAPSRASASSRCSRAARPGRLAPGLDDGARWPRSRSACCSGSRACARRSSRCPTGPSRSPASPARTLALTSELAFLLRAEDDDHVYFVETRGRGVFLQATPIDVSGRLKELLFDAGARRGAHLGDARGRRRLRVREGPPRHRADATSCCCRRRSTSRSRRCSTCRRACPSRGPRVRGPRGRGGGAARSSCSRGRAFVLFTSYANMNAVAERIAGRVDVPDPDPGRGAEGAAARHVPRDARTRCCSRPRPSGRASTWRASSSRA